MCEETQLSHVRATIKKLDQMIATENVRENWDTDADLIMIIAISANEAIQHL